MLARCADANPIGKDSSIASLASPGVKLMDAYLARLADRAGTHVAVGRAIKLFLDEAESLTDIELPFFDMAGNITNTLKDDGGARVSVSCERLLDCRFLTQHVAPAMGFRLLQPLLHWVSGNPFGWRLPLQQSHHYLPHWQYCADMLMQAKVFALKPYVGLCLSLNQIQAPEV